ncbi:MAG: HEAT repeat domain-containing protein [Kofleriaceae bacterium]|nr:HEAT repeat domain-containing protein [Kofleriaceae bacterium]
MRQRTIAVTSALGFAVVAGLVLARYHRGDAASAPSASARPAGPTLAGPSRGAADALGPTLTRRPERGHRYQLTLDVHTRAGAGAAPAAVQVTGELAAAAAAEDEQGRTRVQLHLRGQSTAGQPAQPFVMPGLDQAADALYDGRGALVALAFVDAAGPQARNVLATVAAHLQLVDGPGRVWETTELDPIGPHRVRYQRAADGVDKHKLAYQQVTTSSDLRADLVRSDITVAVGPDGWPRLLTVDEEVALGLEHAGMAVVTRLELRDLGVVEAGPPPALSAAPIAVDQLARAQVASAADDRALVDGASLDQVLATAREVDADQHAAGLQFLRLAALFRLDAAAAAAAGRRLRSSTDGAEVRLLAGALGDSGAPAAQRALAEIAAAGGLDDGRRGQAVVALGLAPSPTPAALAALRLVADGPPGELTDAALLALGNLAMRLREQDPAAALRVVDELLARLAAAGDDSRRAAVVRALGNTGDARVVAALAPLAGAASAELRAAALASLRLVPGPDSTRLLLAGLRDGDSEVRTGAVYALGFHPPAPYVDVVVAHYRQEPAPMVRREILVVAGAYLDEQAPYRSLLEWAARNDPDADLRATATRALQPVPTGSGG